MVSNFDKSKFLTFRKTSFDHFWEKSKFSRKNKTGRKTALVVTKLSKNLLLFEFQMQMDPKSTRLNSMLWQTSEFPVDTTEHS